MQKSSEFPLSVLVETLGFHPWRYSDNTFTDGAGRFLDWQKGQMLLSAYDEAHQRNAVWSFPTPTTLEEAIAAAMSIGWLKERGEAI
jgi:hypothetical protein